MFNGPNNPDVSCHSFLIANLLCKLRQMADNWGNSRAPRDKNDGFKRFQLPLETPIRTVQECSESTIRVYPREIEYSSRKSTVWLEDNDQVIHLPLRPFGVGSYGKGMVVEK